jgi:predicted aminopeptidase
MRLRKKILWVIPVLLVLLGLWYAELLGYAIRQGLGQFRLIWQARPIAEVMADPSVPDSIKTKLKLVEEIRHFAIHSLGLRDTRSYRSLYNQQGKEVLWVVTACKPFELQEKRWWFPVVGQVPYKGFFNPADAVKEKKTLEAAGWEVSIRNPGGWSTLGWFPDPLLSNMLFRSEGDLASLIIHEMAHATWYVKDSADVNENLASFIGDRGAELFLAHKYGPQHAALQQYQEEEQEYTRLTRHVLRGYHLLDSLYASIGQLPLQAKVQAKQRTIRNIIQAADTLKLTRLRNPAAVYTDSLPNNTWFMNFKRYQSKQDQFIREWSEKFNRNLPAYIRYLKTKYPSP